MARHTEYEKVEPDDDADEAPYEINAQASDLEDEQDLDRRTSPDVRRHDEETLTVEEEEEAERLLAGGDEKKAAQRKRGARRSRKRGSTRMKGEGEESSERMYVMEEGGPRSSSAESSGHSSEVDMRGLGEMQARSTKGRVKRYSKFAALHVVIVLAFLALLYGAYRASWASRSDANGANGAEVADDGKQEAARPLVAHTLSNGTHTFAPTTIFISLDGFRADFLNRKLTPTLNSFIRSGVSPKYILPSFPSLTFPNHFTLVTGLYPESHGVVSNTFWDPNIQDQFYYTDPAHSMQPKWWNAEPVWETAELQGVRSAIHMWPGSEVHLGTLEPAYVDGFNDKEDLEVKVERVLYWLDLPGPGEAGERADEPKPQLIQVYVPNVDADGHLYGPNSTYIRSTIAEVDGMLNSLFTGIDERNLTDIVNIVIVSDHGMATTSAHRLIQLEDLLDVNLIEHIDGWPLYGLRPYDHSDAHLQNLYDNLLIKSRLDQYQGSFEVYTKTTMPERYHFTHNDRIAPLWIVPTAGWAVVRKDEFDVAEGLAADLVYHPRGLHGYDHEHPLMRAIFVARGPAFPHPRGSQVDVFQNTEVYNIICDSLGITPVPNNGTLRLPFEPQGTHDFDQPGEELYDPPADSKGHDMMPPEVPNLAFPQTSSPAEDHVPQDVETLLPPEVSNLAIRPDLTFPTDPMPAPVLPSPVHHPFEHSDHAADFQAEAEDAKLPERPVVHDGLDDDEKQGNVDRWWGWVTGKLDAIKGWAGGWYDGETGEDHGDGGDDR